MTRCVSSSLSCQLLSHRNCVIEGAWLLVSDVGIMSSDVQTVRTIAAYVDSLSCPKISNHQLMSRNHESWPLLRTELGIEAALKSQFKFNSL